MDVLLHFLWTMTITWKRFLPGKRLVYGLSTDISAWRSLEGRSNEIIFYWRPNIHYHRGIFSCTSNGALRMTSLPTEGEATTSLASLPTRLQDWRMSSNHETFAYGGDEVDLSVWNTESAFAPRSQEVESVPSKKRKRNNALFPGEIWRANNVAQCPPFVLLQIADTIISLGSQWLTWSSSANTYNFIVIPPSFFGHSSSHNRNTTWKYTSIRYKSCSTPGIGLENRQSWGYQNPCKWNFWTVGRFSHLIYVHYSYLFKRQLFVSDHGYNLFALDLRNGRVMYGYKGISLPHWDVAWINLNRVAGLAGAVTSIAPSPSVMASTALDRYTRIHSTFPPPSKMGQQQEQKGDVLDKVFMKSIPTVVVWDQGEVTDSTTSVSQMDEDDVWGEMEHVEDADDGEITVRTKRGRFP